MDPHRLYSDELTAEEEALGFTKVYVSNPDSYYGSSSIIPAVVLRLGKCSRIIKMVNPVGGFGYSHQVFGTYGSNGRPDWQPVLTAFPTATQAIRAATNGGYQTDPLAQTVRPRPDDLSISLRCPSCSHEFDLREELLPFGSNQTCPSCSTEGETESFNAFNL